MGQKNWGGPEKIVGTGACVAEGGTVEIGGVYPVSFARESLINTGFVWLVTGRSRRGKKTGVKGEGGLVQEWQDRNVLYLEKNELV